MRKILWLVLFLHVSPVLAQQRQIQVRLFAAQLPSEIRIVPQSNTAINGKAVTVPTNISVATANVRVSGIFRVEVSGNAPVRLEQPLTVGIDGDRLRLLIDERLEDYVAAVLAGEAGNFRSMESLKAMAVAIRTFAIRFEGRHRSEGFDFCDTTHCQDFRMSAINDRIRAAVEATEGELLWFNGRPAATYYHQDCGGHTENASSVWPGVREPYLRAQQDPFCVSKGRKDWSTELTTEELRRATGATAVDVVSRTPAGRVQRLRLTGGKTAIVNAEDFRLSVGRVLGWDRLRSDDYELRRVGDRFRFEGHGAGHGVGLCQAGAAQMGESGRGYREILAFYYPDTKLGVTAQGLTWNRSAGERIELESTRMENDRRVIPIADRLMRDVERETGRQFAGRPVVRVYPSVATYRDSTGEPGWVAASTRNGVVRLQPLETLEPNVERTLHHEFMHMLIEQRATPNLPRWFREGLVLVLTEPNGTRPPASLKSSAEMERALLKPRTREEFAQAYADAKAAVSQLTAKYGKQTVLGWIESGLPANTMK
jgi:stage II sporulation protein D